VARSTFVYVTYIRTTREKLWSALTDAEFMVAGPRGDCCGPRETAVTCASGHAGAVPATAG
jgi:hypothetical protein